jgi:hypothetical protein
VRLGPAEEAVRAFRAAADAALAVSRQVGWLEDDRPEETRKKHHSIDASREAFLAAAARFISAAVDLAGTWCPDPSGVIEGTTATGTT